MAVEKEERMGRVRVYLKQIRIALGALVLCGVLFVVSPAVAAPPEFSATVIPISEEEIEWLDQHRELRIGMWLDGAPFMFRGSDGSMQGVTPTYVNAIVKKLGLNPKRIRASNFAALWELARAGEVDVVAAVTAGPERSQDMLLSEPYLHLPIVIVTRIDSAPLSGMKDLIGRTVAVGDGHVPHLRIPDDYPDVNLLPVSSTEQGLQSVLSGQVDAYVASQVGIEYYLRTFNVEGVHIAALTEYSYRVSFGIRKDWPILLTLVNRALASIPGDERKEVNDYWTVLRSSEWMDRPFVWRMVGGIVFVSLMLLMLVVIWNRRLAIEVRGRIRAEERVRRSHNSIQQVIESAEVIIIGLDYTGHVKLFNHAAESTTGYSRDEVVDRNWFDVVVPSERFPYVKEEFSRLVNESGGTGSQSFENPLLTKAGETRHIRWTNSVVRNPEDDLAMISFGTDITDQLLAEEELRLTKFAMDNASVGIFRVRPSGRIVYANRKAAQLMGHTLGALREMSIPDVVEDYDRENWGDFWAQLKSRKVMNFENIMIREDGVTFPAEVSAHYLLFKGMELAIGFFSDISERKRVEGLRVDVERMVRHDLRSPTLAVQTLFALMHKDDNLTDDQRELLESVQRSGRRMLNIIDMSRILYLMEDGAYELQPEDVDILSLTDSIIADLAPYLNAKELSVLVTVDDAPVTETVNYVISSEEILCYGLLSNLLKNAMEAAPDRSVVELDFSRGNGHVISVHNEGVIPESIREIFFDKYVTSGKSHGTGLGTYAAHLIASSLGGDITFTTSESGGTTLTVTLP